MICELEPGDTSLFGYYKLSVIVSARTCSKKKNVRVRDRPLTIDKRKPESLSARCSKNSGAQED